MPILNDRIHMRNRARILENLESIYRESYERARTEGLTARMVELDNAYMRDQLMLEILLDIRDLFSVAPPPREPVPSIRWSSCVGSVAGKRLSAIA